MDMTPLDPIDDFLTLERLRSFTKAAQARNVSQPAFTRRIQLFEQSMGTPLFDRSQTPIALTKAGERFLGYAQNLSKTFAQALGDTRAAGSQIANPLHIATTHTLAITIFPTLWKKCQRKDPSLKVALSGQRMERCLTDLREKTADLALLHSPADQREAFKNEGLAFLKIAQDKLRLVTAPSVGENRSKMLGYAPDIALGELIAKRVGKPSKMEIVFESPSSEVLKAMALAGHGAAYLPELLIEDEVRDGYLVPAAGKNPTIALDVLLVKRTDETRADIQTIWECGKT